MSQWVMEQVSAVLTAIIPVYLIIVVGVALRKLGTLKQQADKGIMLVAVHVMMPALILDQMIGHPTMSQPNFVFSAMAVGFVMITVTVLSAYFLAGIFGFTRGTGKRTFGVTCGIQNYGYLAIPLIASLFPHDGTMAVLFVHNMGVELALWTIALMLLSGDFSFSPKQLLKGPIIAVITGLTINFCGVSGYVPESLRTAMHMLGECALPVALLLIGTALADLWGKEKLCWKISSGAVIIRLVCFPTLMLVTVAFLPLPQTLKQVLVVQAALPAAMFPIILARHHGGQVGVAVQVVMATTAVSLLTTPFVLSIGMRLLSR